MGYYINLKSISLNDYQVKLASDDLLKSRKILKEAINERFAIFKEMGIINLFELQQWLKKKSNWNGLSEHHLMTEEYLTILLRELNSINPKPNKFADFPGIDPIIVARLSELGFSNTEKLFTHILNSESRKNLALLTGFDAPVINELTSLTDLSRIKWASPKFVSMLIRIGFASVAKVASANPIQLHKVINECNNQHAYFKGSIGQNDIKLFVKAANEVSLDVEY